jgi:tRNA-modifying protein YgfZ
MIAGRDNAAMMNLNFSVLLNAPDGEMAVIRARGSEAGSFLQGQLTQDVLLMTTEEARLAAWCSAKGRMLASFIVLKPASDEFLLILSRDLLASTLKRLNMFVLRAKCELTDATAQLSVEGLAGETATAAASNAGMQSTNATLSIANYSISMPSHRLNDSTILVSLPAGHLLEQSVPRALLVRMAAPEGSPDAQRLAAWNALEVSSGIARVSAAISEAFVPQMLNYESTGGVNFKKGCYPGQEVVARSQFRGTLKRRAFIASCAQPMQAGQEVFDSREPEQACGQVAQAAAHPSGGYLAIVSMQISAQSSPALQLGSAGGAALHIHALPYALLEDI